MKKSKLKLVAGAILGLMGTLHDEPVRGGGPSCYAPGVSAPSIAGDPLAGQPFGDQPFDLGEAGPAQLGATFALAAPNLIGDFFGGAIGSGGYIDFDGEILELTVPSPSSGGVVGRQKLVENSSPIPRDRVFFNYSLFQNVRFTPSGIDVNRFVPGFEKTFFDQIVSLEVRAPFASTLNSDVVAGAFFNDTNTEFGNVTLYGKALLHSSDTIAIGAGLGVALPTADDVNVRFIDGEPLIQIQNQAVHLLPYIGGVYAPNDQFYSQFILQFDVDANGNPTSINDFQGFLAPAGTLNDATWCFASFNMGYWMYRTDPSERLSGISPMVEVHYNKALTTLDTVQMGSFQVGQPFTNVEMINAIAGVNLEFFGVSYLTLAYVAPLTTGNDRFFDGEFRALLNRYF